MLFLRQICFYFLPVNEIKPEHSSHVWQCSRPKCHWLLDFFIQFEQTPKRERVYGMNWLTEFHYKSLSDSCLQLCRFTMAVGFDLCWDYSHRDLCWKRNCSILWPLYNAHLCVPPPNTLNTATFMVCLCPWFKEFNWFLSTCFFLFGNYNVYFTFTILN